MTGVTTGEALADLRRLIAAGAIGAHARGDGENERRWLDAQILLDRVTFIDAATLADNEAIEDALRYGRIRVDVHGSWLDVETLPAVIAALTAAALSERTS